jgi:hypothetical protein
MIVEIINLIVLWLNAFPPSRGVSKTYMTGTTLDYAKHWKLPFGAYVEMHEKKTHQHYEGANTSDNLFMAYGQLPRQLQVNMSSHRQTRR